MKTKRAHQARYRRQQEMSLLPIGGRIADFLESPLRFGGLWTMRETGLTVSQEGHRVVVRAEVPGMREEDVKVRVHGDMLEITGEHDSRKEMKRKDSYYLETNSGMIHRSVRLPATTDTGTRKTRFQHGVMTVEFETKK